MTERESDEARRPGVLTAYCAEMEQLANTMCVLLDVAERRADLDLGDDLDPILALEPSVSRLRERLVRTRTRAVTGDLSATATTDWLDEQTIEDMCRSAVHSTVAEMLAARGESWSEGLNILLTSISGSANGEVRSGGATSEAADEHGVDIRPHTRVVPPEQTLAALLEDVGQWASLHGTADTMPIDGLFTMLATSGKTGCLHLRRVDEHLRFVISNGVVVATATTRTGSEELLGEILVEHGWLTTERRQEIVTLSRSKRRPFGAIAIDEGDVSVEQLTEALQEQVHARFDRIFQDRAIAFAFVASDGQDVDGRIFVHAHDLLFQCARHACENTNCEPA